MRRFLLHPGERALEAFAAETGASTTPASRELLDHLATCQRCRSTIAFHRSLRAAVVALPEPEAPNDVLQRILAARVRGERIILPSADIMRTSGVGSRRLAAAALLFAAGGAAYWAARRDEPAELFSSPRSFIRTAEASGLPARRQPSAPALSGVDGIRLRAGRFEFAERWTGSSGRASGGSRITLDVEPATLAGRASWRIASVWSGPAEAHGERVEVETLYVARENLALLQRDVHVSPYLRYSRINIAQQFRGDSVLGRMTAEGGGSPVQRPIARHLPAAFAPYVTEGLSPLMLMSVTLTPGWQRSVSLLWWAVRDNDFFTPVVLRVVGEDRITVPAGTFDCWRLSLEAGGRTIDYWVRKSDGLGIRTRHSSQRTARGVRDIVLVHE